MERQPAEKSYVFDQGYRDVGHAFAVTWGKTFRPVINELGRLGDMLVSGKILGAVIAFLADIIVFGIITLFNITLNTLISLVLIAVLLIAAPVVYASFTLVWLADLLYRTVKRISSRCPNCQNQFDLPVYHCTCGRKHTRLVPSAYGIFKRKCLCGRKIPTTFFNGRHKEKSYCRACGFYVPDGGRHVDICVPVVGGTNAGKTCFIHMAISELEQQAAAANGMRFEYAFSSLNNYQDNIDALRSRRLPDKTMDMRLQYYQFYLTPKGKKIRHLMSLCDVGGELYQDSEQLGQQIGYRHADGFLVIIDPLSVTQYRQEVEKRIRIAGYGPCTMSIDDVLSRLVSVLENLHAISSKTMLKTDVAVVFTKCDIPGLDEIIGSKAVSRCMHSDKLTRSEATNRVCERFLGRYGEDNFVKSLRAKFRSIQYFTCSSLGYNQNGAQFVPDGVVEPVLWLYEKKFQ